MLGLNKMRSAIMVASLLAAVGLGPVAVFADDGGLGDYSPNEYNANPTVQMSQGQLALSSIGQPLDQLVAACMPGTSAVSVQLLPEVNPTFVLVNAINADGSEATSQKLDLSFLKSCAMAAEHEGDKGAAVQAGEVAQDEHMVLQDYQ